MNINEKVKLNGIYSFELWRGGKCIDAWEDANLIPDAAINHILDVACDAAAQVTVWYFGIGTGNYTVAATDTGANIVARVTESSAYTEATRQAVTFAAAAAKAITNSANKAVLTINAGITVTNVFIISVSTKQSSTGTLLSSLKLGTSKVLVSGDELKIGYTLSAA